MNIKKLSAFTLSFFIFFAMGAFLVNAQPTGSGTSPQPTGPGTSPMPTGPGTSPQPTGPGTSPQPTGPNTHIEFPNPFGQNTNLFDVLKSIINNILMPIGGILAVLAFIYSGFLYVIAQGNETTLKQAHRALLYTSVGTALLLGAWVIASLIENTVNQLR